MLSTKDVVYDRLPKSGNQNDLAPKSWKPPGLEKTKSSHATPKIPKTSEKIEIQAVGYSKNQQLKKNNYKKISDE